MPNDELTQSPMMNGSVQECNPNEPQAKGILTRKDALRNHDIIIHFASTGCIITVGCKSIPFSTIDEGIEAVNRYVADPNTEMKIWGSKFQGEN